MSEADEMNNKTNIKEDIKVLREFWKYTQDRVQQSIENILVYTEKLKKENEEYSKQLDLDYVRENYIEKSKIKEIIEKNVHKDTYNFKTIEVSKLQKLLGIEKKGEDK